MDTRLGPPNEIAARRTQLAGRQFWEGTSSELLSMIPPGKVGIPKDSTRLSTAVMKPRITDALKYYGLTVERKRTASRRLLQLGRSVSCVKGEM